MRGLIIQGIIVNIFVIIVFIAKDTWFSKKISHERVRNEENETITEGNDTILTIYYNKKLFSIPFVLIWKHKINETSNASY